jgi:hypothetical protein
MSEALKDAACFLLVSLAVSYLWLSGEFQQPKR